MHFLNYLTSTRETLIIEHIIISGLQQTLQTVALLSDNSLSKNVADTFSTENSLTVTGDALKSGDRYVRIFSCTQKLCGSCVLYKLR